MKMIIKINHIRKTSIYPDVDIDTNILNPKSVTVR